ncbi:hypothetical protein LAD77_00170 [Klebsiella pneumoniae]|nr:hypothetical protein [Klebsiella pneumoniae]
MASLKLVQRVCYANAILTLSPPVFRASVLPHGAAGLFAAPWPISFMRQRCIDALSCCAHDHASLTNSKIQANIAIRSGVEILRDGAGLYIAAATFVALINPHKGKFNVTAKGGLVKRSMVDWVNLPALYLPVCSSGRRPRWASGASCLRPGNEILTVWP